MRSDRRVALLALLSGFQALGCETTLFKVLDHVVGSAPLVSLVVVATFILGLGAGALLSARVRRPGLAEAALAAFNAALIIALPSLSSSSGRVIGALAPSVGANGAAAMLGFAFAAVPSLLLGVTFPALIERRTDATRPYLLQSVGAVAGILTIDALVYPRYGLSTSLSVVTCAHVASTVLLLGRRFTFERRAIGRPSITLFFVGAGTGGFQGQWLLLGALLFRPFYFVQPVVVASMLTGLALGSLAWLAARPRWPTLLSLVALGVAVSTGAAALVAERPSPDSMVGAIVQLPWLVLPGAIPMGAIFPAYLAHAGTTRTESGAALLSLSAGNAAGIVVAGAVLSASLPPLWALAVTLTPIAIVCLWSSPRAALAWIAIVLAVVVAVVSALCTSDSDIIRRAHSPEDGTSDSASIAIDRLFRGPGELSAIHRVVEPHAPFHPRRLYQSGFSPIDLDSRSEPVIAVVGAAYSPHRHRALVVGCGSGQTAGAVARIFEHTDIIDLAATVPDLVRALRFDNFLLESRLGKSATLLQIDGVLAPAVLSGPYDLIVLTVDPGYHALANKLYSVDYYRALKPMLAKGGVVITWSDATLDEEANQILINTGQAAFRRQKLFSALVNARVHPVVGYYFLVHSDEDLVYAPDRFGLASMFSSEPEVTKLPGLRPPNGPGSTGTACPTRDDACADTETDRLLDLRFSLTTRVQTADRPASQLLFGGFHREGLRPLEARPLTGS